MYTQKKQGTMAAIKEMAVLLIIVFIIRTFGFGLYQVPTGSMETTVLVGERFFADKFTILFKAPQRGDIIAFNDPRFKYSENPLMRLWQQYVWGPINLTKRIIAGPGDRIKGVIEDGKPVIYLNDQKLDEPYLNKYPIIRVFKEDPEQVVKDVERQVATWLEGGMIDPSRAQEAMAALMLSGEYTVLKSYDPAISFDKQPFYRINPEHIVKGIDGKPIEELYPGTVVPTMQPVKMNGVNYWGNNSDEFYVELSKTEYWCMGDNRLGSGDSRTFGPVDLKHIHGKILFRIWSLDSDESWWIVDLLKHPIDFWSRMRWDRFFQRVY